ncbi:uncharacterized protein LOC101860603 [Aplysia californica]|uniref:Uncharacterized protein LOC101860603 n=1 Tax=Aplysia californica TaxID=6500 RepID=A0ABM0K3W4_APLCA|nr:uncharacterized protein LOC101860603 [Aplysia californica]
MTSSSIILGNDAFDIIQPIVVYGLSFPISVIGLVFNVINTAVFLKIGVNDSVSVSLVALFVADFVFLLLQAYRPIAQMLMKLGLTHTWSVHPTQIATFASSYISIFYLISTLLTTYIALARCLCVALAFRFQRIFTVNQARIVVVSVYIGALLSHIPPILSQRLVWRSKVNTPKAILVVERVDHDTFESFSKLHNIVNRTLLPYSCLAICILCLIVLTVKLRSVSQFRANATRSASKPDPRLSHGKHELDNNAEKEQITSSSPSALSIKEIQLIKAVFLLCAIFVCSASLRAALGIAVVWMPQLETEPRYRSLYAICMEIIGAFMVVNCAVNFIIFYHYNTSFRQTLTSLTKRSVKK